MTPAVAVRTSVNCFMISMTPIVWTGIDLVTDWTKGGLSGAGRR